MGPNAHITRIRVMQRLACKRHQSFGLIVMDLESAFYKTVRGILLQNAQEAMSAEFLAYLFRALDLPPLLYDDFLQQMKRNTVLEEGKTNRAIQRVLGSMMQGAWSRLRLPGDDRIMVPETGTRPGDPIADIMFSLVMCRFLENVESRMVQTLGTSWRNLTMEHLKGCSSGEAFETVSDDKSKD